MNHAAQVKKAEAFAKLHQPGTPLILANIWDVASAGAVAKAGAKALATSSWAVAVAQGYGDGEKLPRERLMDSAAHIAAAHELPLTVDCEAGYGKDPEAVAATAALVIAAGGVGMNLEDQMIGEGRLYSVAEQAERIRAGRTAADRAGVPLFINARTDIFLKAPRETHGGEHADAALERAAAYAKAGASGFFVPGLLVPDLIERICERSPLPVNLMAGPTAPPAKALAALGVARISLGPWPLRLMLAALEATATHYFSEGVLEARPPV
jgi:2-methylisocitrate lyase-like PEP mutase family enzyme